MIDRMTGTVKNLKLTTSEIENLDGLLYDLELLYKDKHDPISEELFDEVKAFRSRLSTKLPSVVLETLEWNVVQCLRDLEKYCSIVVGDCKLDNIQRNYTYKDSNVYRATFEGYTVNFAICHSGLSRFYYVRFF